MTTATATSKTSPPKAGGLRLVRQAFDDLLATATGAGSFPAGILCVVAAAGTDRLLADLADRATAAGARVIASDGGSLGQDIERALAVENWERLRKRLVAADLVVVERLDTLGGLRRQTVFRQLLDATITAGIPWCVSLAELPAAALDAGLAARLAGGLVIPLPARLGCTPAGTEPGARNAATPPTIARIFSTTAAHFDLSLTELVAGGRSRHISHARSLAMYLARELTGRSFAHIARACGGRDHTTALHATQVVKARLAADPSIAADAAVIVSRLSAKPVGRRHDQPRPAGESPCQ